MKVGDEKVKVTVDGELYFWCDGCKSYHSLYVKPHKDYPIWSFNNNLQNPTLRPSVLVTIGHYPEPNDICHSFITDGKIQYLNDCTHDLKGQTIELKSNFKGWW